MAQNEKPTTAIRGKRQSLEAWLPFTLLTLCLCLSGCGYGEVSSKTYEFSTALYNISNRKMSDKLADIKMQIGEARDANEISKKEYQWLSRIVRNAEREEWKQAMKSARRMMEDQVTSNDLRKNNFPR